MFEWFKRKQKNNALALMTESNSQLRQLLFQEQKHSADLLTLLTNAMQNKGEGYTETATKVQGEPTPTELKVLALFNDVDTLSAQDITNTLGYSCRQMASKHCSNLLRKGLVVKTGSGKNVRYKKA